MKTSPIVNLFRTGLVLVAWSACHVVGEEPNTLSAKEKSEGWRLLFDGKSLDGWKAGEAPESFRVEGDIIVAAGPRSHLYYAGPMPDRGFRNFELSMEVLTWPGSNSGVYFHTSFQETGYPAAGYEVQINNSDPPGAPSSSPSRTGSLWGVADLADAEAPDGDWFELKIRVEDQRIVTAINGTVMVDYEEPAGIVRPTRLAGKLLSSGTFALQASSTDSPTVFRSIKVRELGQGESKENTNTSQTPAPAFGRDSVSGKTFRMHWLQGKEVGVFGEITLQPDGKIAGAPSEREARWKMDNGGNLVIYGKSGEITSVYETHSFQDNRWIVAGVSKAVPGIGFRLDEKLVLPGALDDESINRIIRPWSKQQVFGLDPEETFRWQSNAGKKHSIQLLDVTERKDSVVRLVRSADIRVAIDGTPLELFCAPYVMPTEVGDLRIQADITSGMVPELSKRVSFSIWDASDPIVDTEAFRFPLKNYRLLSHELQAYGEIAWLGKYDGDPRGVTARHSYGIDLAGYENNVEVLAVADGIVHDVYPTSQDPYAALIRSSNGVIWEYGHMQSLLPGIREGAVIHAGQVIGMLGKRGGSGNFSHLHLGQHPSPAYRTSVIRTQRLNYFPWIVTSYLAEHPQSLFAIAGAHQVVRAGETCFFDGSHSLAFGPEIVRYRWTFPDGTQVENALAEKTFLNAGVFVAQLEVENTDGRRDIDFCRVEVFPRSSRVDGMPTIFLSHTPTLGGQPGQPMRIRGWVQSDEEATMRLEFGDGSVQENYSPYDEVSHVYAQPGLYVVTASAVVEGVPVMQKQAVLVGGGGQTATGETQTKQIPAGLGGLRGSRAGKILVGAGRNADGSLVNPDQVLPEGLPTISADIEVLNLKKGEKVEVWVEQGTNHTQPIAADIQGEGNGNIPFDLHLGDTPFPPGTYKLVVGIGEKGRFEKEFRIGAGN